MIKRKRQLHDGIAGALITAGVALKYYIHPGWLLLPGNPGRHAPAKRVYRILPRLFHSG